MIDLLCRMLYTKNGIRDRYMTASFPVPAILLPGPRITLSCPRRFGEGRYLHMNRQIDRFFRREVMGKD